MEKAEIDIAKRDALVLANIPFVHSRIREKWRHFKNSEHYDDAVSEGIVGLFEAAERFDESKGFTFITFAVHWIDHQIRRYDDAMKSPVYLPANRIMQGKILAKTFRMRRGGRKVKLSELLPEEAPLHPGYILNILSAKKAMTNVFLDKPSPTPTPFDNLCDQTARQTVRRLLESVDSRAENMLRNRYGFSGDEMTLEEVAEPWGLTRERARQILNAAHRTLRRSLPYHSRREVLEHFFTEENPGLEPRWAPEESNEDDPEGYFTAPTYGWLFDCPHCGSRVHGVNSKRFSCEECGFDNKAAPDCSVCGDPVLLGFPCYCDFLEPREERTLKWHLHRVLLLASGCTLERLLHELEAAGFLRSPREIQARLQRDDAVLKGADGNYYLLENAPQRLLDLDRLERKLERLDAEFEAKSRYLTAQMKAARRVPERLATLRQELLTAEEEYLKEKERLLAELEGTAQGK